MGLEETAKWNSIWRLV